MAITGFGMIGVMELLLVGLLGTGVGIPLGIPPQDPDPMMAQVAPEKCLYFATWMGMAKPDPGSPNQTEQLFAEPEMQAFVEEVLRAFEAATEKVAGQAPDQELAMIIEKMPLLVTTLISHPTTIYVESVAPGLGGITGKGALVVKLGDEADEVGGVVKRFVATAPPEAAREVRIQEVDCIELQLAAEVPIITVGQKDDYLIVAVGDGSFAELLQRAATPPPAWLTDAVDSLEVPRLATFAYADLASIFEVAAQFGGPEMEQMLDLLGLSAMSTVVSVSGLDETGFVSRARITSSEPDRGVAGLLSGEPLTAQDLAGIPHDASLALALRVDLQEVLDKSLELLTEVEPRAAEELRMAIDQTTQAVGINIQDVLGSLGDVWTLHAAPSGGGLTAGWTLAVDLQDAEKAQDEHQKLLRFANAIFDQEFLTPRIRKFEHRGQNAYTFEVPDDDFFVAPTWCLTDSHFVVTLLPQTMKSYLNQMDAPQSLADLPAVARVLESGPCSISYQDMQAQFVMLYPLLQYGAQLLQRQMRVEDFDIDVTKLPSITAVAPHLLPTVSAARRVDDGYESYTHTTLPSVNLGASAPVLVAGLVPAIQAMRASARRAQSSNNLKMIALAIHNYHDVFKGIPAAYNTDENGKPLLSWRVHILPFVEHSNLYDQFHLDEPWDSEHNRKLIARMPGAYRSPISAADPGKTIYLGNASKDGIFVPPKDDANREKTPTGTRFRDIRDGTSNTIMVIEANDPSAVIWTKPDDFELDADNPLRGLSGNRPGVFMVGFCDGSVRSLSLDIPRETLKALFTRSGAEPIDNQQLR